MIPSSGNILGTSIAGKPEHYRGSRRPLGDGGQERGAPALGDRGLPSKAEASGAGELNSNEIKMLVDMCMAVNLGK
jgi:hypothetical protein